MHEIGLGEIIHRLILLAFVGEILIEDGDCCFVTMSLPIDGQYFEACFMQEQTEPTMSCANFSRFAADRSPRIWGAALGFAIHAFCVCALLSRKRGSHGETVVVNSYLLLALSSGDRS